MTHFLTLSLLCAFVTGAVFYRMRGGAPSWPRPVEQMLFCLIFPVTLAVHNVPFVWQCIGYIVPVIAVLTGHGQYFLKKYLLAAMEAIEPETMDFVLVRLFGKDPRTDSKYEIWRDEDMRMGPEYTDAMWNLSREVEEYGHRKLFWRCVAGLALTGGIVSIVPGLILMVFDPFHGVVLALSGFIAKGGSYLASYYAGYGTEGGEFGTGGVQWLIAATLCVVLIWGVVA